MSHIVKLGSAAIAGVQFLTGMTITQTDPGVQTASRGTGATISNAANDPMGFIAFFNGSLKRFLDVESVSGTSENDSHRRGTASCRSRR
jgi:hypothetical protein